jgi:hypothetical protein
MGSNTGLENEVRVLNRDDTALGCTPRIAGQNEVQWDDIVRA